MRTLRNLLIWILVIGATLAAALKVLITYPANLPGAPQAKQLVHDLLLSLQPQLDRINLRMEHGQFLFWLTFLILALLVILFHTFSRPRRLQIERHVEGGRVLMSPAATKHYIATALAPFSDLLCRKIELHQGRRGLEAVVYADLRTQEDVPALERQLIDRVHSALTSDLGIENVSKVSVVIREFGLPKGMTPKPVPAVPVPEAAVAPVAPAATPAAVPVATSQKVGTVKPGAAETAAVPEPAPPKESETVLVVDESPRPVTTDGDAAGASPSVESLPGSEVRPADEDR